MENIESSSQSMARNELQQLPRTPKANGQRGSKDPLLTYDRSNGFVYMLIYEDTANVYIMEPNKHLTTVWDS